MKVKQVKSSEKKPYHTPKLTVHGDVDKITQAHGTGSHLDMSFEQGTSAGEITFSTP